MGTRVLVVDNLDPNSFAELTSLGVELVFKPDITADALPSAMAGVKVLVVRSTKVSAAAIDAGKELSLIVRAGSGVNTIDVAAASARGIYVSNCPGKNGIAVAELTMGLILALDRRIPDNVADIRKGAWDKKGYSKARGLKGQRLGLVGFGAIGREVAKRALAFDVKVHAYSRSLTEEDAAANGVTRAISLDHVFASSDIVSLHLALTSATRHVVTRDLIGRMRRGAMLINTARAELVDAEALLEAVKGGKIRVATDVWSVEPEGGKGDFADPLGALPGVIGTHHIGASTEQAQEATAAETVRIVRRFVETGEVDGAVNLLLKPVVAGTIVVRHLDRVGVLASVLAALKRANINVETMENVVFTGGQAACARIRVAQWPPPDVVGEVASLENVLHVDVV